MDTLFLDRMLVLLAQGSFTATYKYALMLALIDLCLTPRATRAASTSRALHTWAAGAPRPGFSRESCSFALPGPCPPHA